MGADGDKEKKMTDREQYEPGPARGAQIQIAGTNRTFTTGDQPE